MAQIACFYIYSYMITLQATVLFDFGRVDTTLLFSQALTVFAPSAL